MSIRKIAECDVCHKQTDFYESHDKWFIVNVSHVYCSEDCYDKSNKTDVGLHKESKNCSLGYHYNCSQDTTCGCACHDQDFKDK